MRIFKQRGNSNERYTTRYTGITESPDGGGFHEMTAEVEGPREALNPDVMPDWKLGHMGSDQFFTHIPASLNSLSWTRGSGGPSFEGVEAVRRDAKKMYREELGGPGGKLSNTTIGELEPNVISKDDMSLMELDPDVTEITGIQREKSALVQKLSAGAEAAYKKNALSQQFTQPRLPGM